MSINMVISEKTIDAVVTHQFDSANDALNVNKSVEISGFGKFFFNDKKAVTQYNKLLNIKRTYENVS
jgi:nucleoid DNA-binding protein